MLQLASAYDPAEPDHGRSSARIALIRGRQPMPSIDNSMHSGTATSITNALRAAPASRATTMGGKAPICAADHVLIWLNAL
jgi:hypothetical protein